MLKPNLKKLSSLLIIIFLLSPLGFNSLPKVYAVDDIDYCLSDLSGKQSSTFASGTGWNITVSGNNCIFLNWNPIVDGSVNDSPGHIGPWTIGDNTTALMSIIGDHPSDYEHRAYVDWSIVPIKIGVNVTGLSWILNVSSLADSYNIHNVTDNPLEATASELFNDTADGTEYYSGNLGGGSGVRTVGLGASAMSELSTIRNNSGIRFGIGIHAFTQSSWSYIFSEDSPGNTNQILKVTYVRIPSDPPDFSTMTLTSQSELLYTGQNNLLTAFYSYGGSGISGLTITFQSSPDNSTWTNIMNQTTNSLGYSNINYGQSESGTWYFRAYYPEGSYPTKTSSSVTVEYQQMPGSSTPPPSQTPSSSPGPTTSQNILTVIWCSIFDCGVTVSPAPGDSIPPDLDLSDSIILPLDSPGYVPYEDVNPIIKPVVDAIMFITGTDKSLIETVEGIVEAVPESTVLISWGLVFVMIILIVAIALFGRIKIKSFRG